MDMRYLPLLILACLACTPDEPEPVRPHGPITYSAHPIELPELAPKIKGYESSLPPGAQEVTFADGSKGYMTITQGPPDLSKDPMFSGLTVNKGQSGVRIEVVKGPKLKTAGPTTKDPTPTMPAQRLDIVSTLTGQVFRTLTTDPEGLAKIALDPGAWTINLRPCPGVKGSIGATYSFTASPDQGRIVRLGCLLRPDEIKPTPNP